MKRYRLISVNFDGERVASCQAAMRRPMAIGLGILAIAVGIALWRESRDTTAIYVLWSGGIVFTRKLALAAPGIILMVAGALCVLWRSSFRLDAADRSWRERATVAGLGRRRGGSFDDCLGLQLVKCEISDRTVYAVVWRWKTPGRPGRCLTYSANYRKAYRRWVDAGRSLGLPLLEMTASAFIERQADEVEARLQPTSHPRNIAALTPAAPPRGSKVVCDPSQNRVELRLPWRLFTRPVVELAPQGIALRRWPRLFRRTRSIPWADVRSVQCVAGYCGETEVLIRVGERIVRVGQTLKDRDRPWLADVLRQAMDAPAIDG